VTLDVTADPTTSARDAHCRYVDDRTPGIRRVRSGRGFTYVGADGRRVRDGGELARIAALVIPPAWTDVWICPSPDGHLQATGRDARARKQYRYHERFRQARDETKYARMIAFAGALPAVRARIDEDLARPGVTRERVLATVVRLLEISLIRIGNEEYARANGSFGLTTMRSRHVDVTGSTITFRFRGKSGKEHVVAVHDRRVARIVARCNDLPGEILFQYEDDQPHAVEASDVNDYLREVTGADFTAKDFRTWAGTVLAAEALAAADEATHAALTRAVKAVAARLGNTPAVCRRCYVHPDIIGAFFDGTLSRAIGAPKPHRARAGDEVQHGSLSGLEAAVLRLLRRRGPRSRRGVGPRALTARAA
jgi:DNA topoisomerase-1